MQEILKYIPVLAVAMAINVALGMYYNIGTKKYIFDINKLLNGIIKAIIVGSGFLGLAFCFDATDLSSIGLTPQIIINAAITLYVGKAAISLTKVLGLDADNLKENKKGLT